MNKILVKACVSEVIFGFCRFLFCGFVIFLFVLFFAMDLANVSVKHGITEDH